MEIKYIFTFTKSDENFKSNEIEENLLNKVFTPLQDNYYLYENNNEKIEFKVNLDYKMIDSAVYLKIFTSDTNLQVAKDLASVDYALRANEYRKKYCIQSVYDEASKYLCEDAYKLLGEYERKLRQLIYLVFIKSYGQNWYATISTKDTEDIIKQRQGNNKRSENILECFTLYELECFLFTPIPEKTITETFENPEKIESTCSQKSNTELSALIKELYPISRWDKTFSKDFGKDFIKEEELQKIRDFRNIVAHNKNFSLKDYKENIEVVILFIKKLDTAIKNTETGKTNSQQLNNLADSFSNLISIKSMLPKINMELPQDFISNIIEINNPMIKLADTIKAQTLPILQTATLPFAEMIQKNQFLNKSLLQLCEIQKPYLNSLMLSTFEPPESLLKLAIESQKIQEQMAGILKNIPSIIPNID